MKLREACVYFHSKNSFSYRHMSLRAFIEQIQYSMGNACLRCRKVLRHTFFHLLFRLLEKASTDIAIEFYLIKVHEISPI